MAKKIKSQKSHQSGNSQNQESPQNSLTDPQQDPNDDPSENIPQSQPDATIIPFKQYQKSFIIFNKKSRSTQFKSYAKFKPNPSFDYFKTTFTQASGLSFGDNLNQSNKCNKPPSMFQENTFVCKIPSNTTIFIHIYEAGNNKCQIRVMNSSGYVYAYFVEIKTCRKFSKIYKIIKKINSPTEHKKQSEHLFVICDQPGCVQNQLSYIKKIADFKSQFCYYFYTDNKKTLSLDLKRTTKNSKPQKGKFLQQDNLFCFYSNIFTSNMQLQENINKIIKVQHEIQNLSQFAFNSSEGSANFILKSILVNYQKFFKITDKNEMYASLKTMITDFELTLQKKQQFVYGDPQDHYPQLMQGDCKPCVHCPYNKSRINQFELEKQMEKQKKSFLYDIENQQSQLKAKHVKEIPHKSNKQSKKVKHFESINEKQEQNVKIRKSKYICQGCTAAAKKIVPLCIKCFGDYHIRKDKIKEKNKRKSANKNLQKKRLQALKWRDEIVMSDLNKENPQKQEIIDEMKNSDKELQLMSQKESENQMSQNENKEWNFTTDEILLPLEFIKSQQLNSLLQQINIERDQFMKTFAGLYTNPKTRKIALNIVQHVQLKLTQLISP